VKVTPRDDCDDNDRDRCEQRYRLHLDGSWIRMAPGSIILSTPK
jgi:hypothetical protein